MIQVGEVYSTKNNGDLEITHYENAANITVKFFATGYIAKAQQGDIRRGDVKDFLLPNIYSIGYMGGLKYTYKKDTKCYKTWHDMFLRCYAPDRTKNNAAYHDCTVCTEWHNFQNFAPWFYENYVDGYQLDKDIITEANKSYSPENCHFVSPADNSQAARNTLNETYQLIDAEGTIHTFDNQRQFCLEHNLHTGSISNILNGKRKSHKGFKKYDKSCNS